jgi:small-conductance mechanosensitive channel
VWTLVYVTLLILLLFFVTGKMRNWLAHHVLIRSSMVVGAREATASIIQYVALFIGLMVILQTAGIDLTALTVLAGGLSLGIGFGLQTIINNFVSGLIILFERPIKIGDRIEVGNVQGDVVRIGGRSTTILTNDGIAIIVPNLKFIMENVVNWSHSGESVRFRIPVAVAYDSDVRLVEKLLLDVAQENPDVLHMPPPAARFTAFGESGLKFELLVWSSSLLQRRGKLTSDLNFAIYAKLRQHNVEIPYPHLDLRIRSGTAELP